MELDTPLLNGKSGWYSNPEQLAKLMGLSTMKVVQFDMLDSTIRLPNIIKLHIS